MNETLLRYVGSRYEQAQASSDELRLRALELIVAACVTEWRRTPRAVTSPAPLPAYSDDDVPKIDYDDLMPELDEEDEDLEVSPLAAVEPGTEPKTEPERAEERVWWEAPAQPTPTEPGSEPVRGAWEPPRRS